MSRQLEKSISGRRRVPSGAERNATNQIEACAARELIDIGAEFHSRGWSLATSSNYSVVLDREPLRLLVTASGKDKSRLRESDFVVVGDDGRSVTPTNERPSAETLLHVVLARQPAIGAVLHTHSIWATLLTDWRREAGCVRLSGYEMLKGLEGIRTHEAVVDVPIFDNTQDIPALAAEVERWLCDGKTLPRLGFLIHHHGLYTWGRDLPEARRHVEALEFLFEVLGRGMEPPRHQERQNH
jgi:methylthioribulose-1-phosphate dehydratase